MLTMLQHPDQHRGELLVHERRQARPIEQMKLDEEIAGVNRLDIRMPAGETSPFPPIRALGRVNALGKGPRHLEIPRREQEFVDLIEKTLAQRTNQEPFQMPIEFPCPEKIKKPIQVRSSCFEAIQNEQGEGGPELERDKDGK
jgi:hypothetical protein